MAPRKNKIVGKAMMSGKKVTTTTVLINYGDDNDDDDKEKDTKKDDDKNTNNKDDKDTDKKKSGNKSKSSSSDDNNNNNDDDDDDDVYKDVEEVNEDEDDEDDEDDDDEDEDEEECLHCHLQRSSDVQVRCDECASYICNTCHWCHEFQANHEIRVCDRCDAFYCRGCDEMDQCDDCGEVVCATCSTLLSCKFCGGGLCEDCATACGRCGIVLCSKDAKFAVDCDTCRLSYCLVCLASGNKDPCVRCGHRPSKRMEQLVHLRLKSIYKAFKQSSTAAAASSISSSATSAAAAAASSSTSAANAKSSKNSATSATASGRSGSSSRSKNNNNARSVDECLDEYDLSDDPAALMMAAAATASAVHKATTAAAKGGSGSSSSHHHGHGGSGGSSSTSAKHKREAAAAAAAAAAATNSTNAVKEAVEKYKAEKAKADAAAAALLAELDEEEEQVNAKKKRKKKKRERKQRTTKEEQQHNEEEEDDRKVAAKEISTAARPDSPSSQASSAPSLTAIVAGATLKHAEASAATTPSASTMLLQEDDDNDDGWQQTKKDTRRQKSPSKSDSAATEEEIAQDVSSHDSQPPDEDAGSDGPEVDPLEQQFETLEEQQDVEGLTELLASVKGVVGRAVLRKNIKKALKRFKAAAAAAEAEQRALEQAAQAEEEEEVIVLPSVSGNNLGAPVGKGSSRPGAVTPVMPEGVLRTGELLRVVSHQSTAGGSVVPSCTSSSTTAPRAANTASECVMHIAPTIVGLIIGKGGQRIRDMMNESGTKIWIDQAGMNPQDQRILYVTGNKKNVDAAVSMIKDLVAKAPAETPQPQAQTTAVVDVAPHSAPAEMTQHALKSAPVSSGSGNADGVPDMLNAENFRLRPRRASGPAGGKSSNGEANRARHEITCDPRFVPLLIGRRGWTVKNIQDSSGARVDIDQTVTPRKITISGSDTSVEIAVRMVRDVLSYPHSQLHGTGGQHLHSGNSHAHKPIGKQDEPEHYPLNPEHFPLPTKPEDFPVPRKPEDISSSTKSPAVPEPVKRPAPSPPAPPAPKPVEPPVVPVAPSPPAAEPVKEGERPHSPPPSSLIMPGDAKSTISASSSLSSTPEPSMGSSSKGNIAAVAPGPMLPSVFGSGQQAQQAQQQHPAQNSPNAYGAFPPSGLIAPGGNMMGYGPAKDPSFGQPSPSPPLPVGGPSMVQNHQMPGAAPMGNRMRPPPGPFPFSSMPGDPQTQLPMHQQSAFQSSGPGFPHAQATPDSQRCISNPLQSPNSGGAMTRPGMWNQAPVPPLGPAAPPQLPPAPPAGPEGFGLAAAVDFLHHSAAQPTRPATLPLQPQHGTGGRVSGSGMNAILGLPSPSRSVNQQPELTSIGLERGPSQPLLPPGTPGREDSRMVDSLFGPSDLGGGNDGTGIVGGLRGLSLDNDTAGPGLWGAAAGSSAVQGDTLPTLRSGFPADLGNANNTPQQPQSSLFSTTGLDAGLMNNNRDMNNSHHNIHVNQHPPQSRFAWGEGQQRDG